MHPEKLLHRPREIAGTAPSRAVKFEHPGFVRMQPAFVENDHPAQAGHLHPHRKRTRHRQRDTLVAEESIHASDHIDQTRPGRGVDRQRIVQKVVTGGVNHRAMEVFTGLAGYRGASLIRDRTGASRKAQPSTA